MKQLNPTEKVKILRYGELLMRKAREDANLKELEEMDRIRKELDLSEEQLINLVEHVVKSRY